MGAEGGETAVLTPSVAEFHPGVFRKFKPRAFARALIDGCTLAEAARRAGSEAVSEEARQVQGSRWLASPRVMQMLRDISPTTAWGVCGGVKWMAEAANGIVKVSDQDRIDIVNTLGRLAGLFVTKIDVSGNVQVEVRGLRSALTPVVLDASLVQPAALPALPASTSSLTDAELLAELARRGLAQPALVPTVKPA